MFLHQSRGGKRFRQAFLVTVKLPLAWVPRIYSALVQVLAFSSFQLLAAVQLGRQWMMVEVFKSWPFVWGKWMVVLSSDCRLANPSRCRQRMAQQVGVFSVPVSHFYSGSPLLAPTLLFCPSLSLPLK